MWSFMQSQMSRTGRETQTDGNNGVNGGRNVEARYQNMKRSTPTLQCPFTNRPGWSHAKKFSALLLSPALALSVCAAQSSPAKEAAGAYHSPASATCRGELDRSIDRVLERPEYSWRMPRPTAAKDGKVPGFVSRLAADIGEAMTSAARFVGRQVEKFFNWLFQSRDRPSMDVSTGLPASPFPLLVLCLTLSACILGLMLYRMWRTRRTVTTAAASPILAKPDILDESVSADDLPPDEWRNMADELLARGEYRLAIRAMFLASLARLARNGRITLARCKSNRDYTAELRRKAHDFPAILTPFIAAVMVLEEVWYGTHSANAEAADSFRDIVEPIFEDNPAVRNPGGGYPG